MMNARRKVLKWLILAVLALVASGCGGDSGGGVDPAATTSGSGTLADPYVLQTNETYDITVMGMQAFCGASFDLYCTDFDKDYVSTRFTVPADGTYRLSVTGVDPGYDAVLYVYQSDSPTSTTISYIGTVDFAGDGGSESAEDTMLAGYYYYVFLQMWGGEDTVQVRVEALSATTPVSAPAAPSSLNASPTSSSSISLSWTDNANDETGYSVERSTSSSTGFTQIGTVGANATSYTSSGLNASTTYYYRVRAYNSVGDSGYSNTAWAMTQAPSVTIPATPTSVDVTNITPTSATLTWQDNSDNESVFEIGYCTGLVAVSGTGLIKCSYGFTVVGTAAANSTSYTLSGLAPSTGYSRFVRAANSAGASDNLGVSFSTLSTIWTYYPAKDVPKIIPTYRTGPTVDSTLFIENGPTSIADINLDLDITKDVFVGSLNVSLISPAGTSVLLSNNNGGSGSDYTNTTFDDEASTAIADAFPPFTGTFTPDNPLSTFDGENANGMWTLRVWNGSDSTGTINSWGIEVQ